MGVCLSATARDMENENNPSASLNRIKSSRPIESSVLRSCRPFSRRNAHPLDSSTTRTDGPPLYVINISLNGDNSLKVIDDQWTSENTFPDPGKRKPIVIQRTIKNDSDIFYIPSVPIIFILGQIQNLEVEFDLQKLTEFTSKQFHHLEMDSIFVDALPTIGGSDSNAIPPFKTLELLINQIVSIPNQTELDAILITGYPRNMRDVVEYTARVERVDGVIFIGSREMFDDSQIAIDNKTDQDVFSLVQYFKQYHEEDFYVVFNERPILNIQSEIHQILMYILKKF